MSDEELAIFSAVRVNDSGSGNVLELNGTRYVLTNAHVLQDIFGNVTIFPEPSIDPSSDAEWDYRGEMSRDWSRTFLLHDGFYTTIQDPEGGLVIARYVGTLVNTPHFLEGEENAFYDLGILEILDESHPAVEHIRTIFENDIVPEDGLLSIFSAEYGIDRQAVTIDNAHEAIIAEHGPYSLSGFPGQFEGLQVNISSNYQFGDDPNRQNGLFIELEGARDAFLHGASGSVAFSNGVPIAAHARLGRCDSLASPAHPALYFINETIPSLNEAGYDLTLQMRPHSYDKPPSEWRFDLVEQQSGRVLDSQETEDVLAELNISRDPVQQRSFTDEQLAGFRQAYDVCDVDAPTQPIITAQGVPHVPAIRQ